MEITSIDFEMHQIDETNWEIILCDQNTRIVGKYLISKNNNVISVVYHTIVSSNDPNTRLMYYHTFDRVHKFITTEFHRNGVTFEYSVIKGT